MQGLDSVAMRGADYDWDNWAGLSPKELEARAAAVENEKRAAEDPLRSLLRHLHARASSGRKSENASSKAGQRAAHRAPRCNTALNSVVVAVLCVSPAAVACWTLQSCSSGPGSEE